MLYGEIIRQRLKLIGEHVVADTIDYLEAMFAFQTDDWNGLEKWAHFSMKGVVYDIPLTDDRIRKEDHLNLSAGIWSVYLHGNEFRDGNVIERITTNTETLRVFPTGALDGEPFPEIPASVAEQILARLANVEKNGPGGLAPVDKTDYMTAEVGRDANGHLWTAGTQKGVTDVKITGNAGSGFSLWTTLENGITIINPLPTLDFGDAVRVESRAPKSSNTFGEEDYGEIGWLWLDASTAVLYIAVDANSSGGLVIPNYTKWLPISGANGLPEHTDADEGKFLRIVNGAAAWTDGVSDAEGLIAAAAAGGVIILAPDADITVSEALTLPEGTTLIGNGATIRRDPGFNGRIFTLSSDCRIENLVIYGNRTNVVNPGWQDTREISMKTESRRSVVENVTIYDGNDAITVSGYDHIVRGCRLYNCGGNGIHMGELYGMLIDGCTIIGANKNASVMGNSRGCIYTCMYVYDLNVVNCYCEDGLAGVGGLDAPDNARINVANCIIKNCKRAVEGEIVDTGGPVEVSFVGNQFLNCNDFLLSDTSHDYPPGDDLIVSGNRFVGTSLTVHGFRRVNISGNTMHGGGIDVARSPYCLISGNTIDSPHTTIPIYVEASPYANVSGNNTRGQRYGVYSLSSHGIMISGNEMRQCPHNISGVDFVKLLYTDEATVDNNKLFVYNGTGMLGGSNNRITGNIIVMADSSQIAIRVWGGGKNYLVAQNMSNGTFGIANGTNAVIQNNITIESAAFADVVYTLTNITTDGFAKALTADDFEFTLTAADGYVLPETITVTMGGTALAVGTGYTYDAATGAVVVYRVSGAVEVTAGGAAE